MDKLYSESICSNKINKKNLLSVTNSKYKISDVRHLNVYPEKVWPLIRRCEVLDKLHLDRKRD